MDGENFDCATWLHKAKEMPKGDSRVRSIATSRGRRQSLGRLSTSSFTRVSYLWSGKLWKQWPLCSEPTSLGLLPGDSPR